MPERQTTGDTLQHAPALSAACQAVVAAVLPLARQRQRPVVVALDGGSGAGKSTLAAALAQQFGAVVVPLDDFFAGHIARSGWQARTPAQRARDVFDWRRVRSEALEPLLAGRRAAWRPFDFEAGCRADGTYGVSAQTVGREPARVIVLDGAYSCSPPLSDLVDIAVLVDVPVQERRRRLAEQEEAGFLAAWHALWDEVEDYYSTHVRPGISFDLVVSGV